MSAAPLVDVLEEARARGFLGPGSVGQHVEHTERLARLVGPAPARFLDLGSGGGVPGLVLAMRWPGSEGVLVDATQRRCEWLEHAAGRLECSSRVTVRCGRAEELARVADLRETFPLVVARAFGPPATTAECAVGFLAPGGSLVVSEPPETTSAELARWPERSLAELGFGPPQQRRDGPVGVVVVTRTKPLSDRWPRRVGVPAKRPLWNPAASPTTR